MSAKGIKTSDPSNASKQRVSPRNGVDAKIRLVVFPMQRYKCRSDAGNAIIIVIGIAPLADANDNNILSHR